METNPEEVIVHATTVDVLIERLSTHPAEFFNASTLSQLDAAKTLSGTKWRTLTAHLCNPATTGLFSKDEKEKFAKALDVAMRDALDAQIMRAVMMGEPLGAEFSETVKTSHAAAVQFNQVVRNMASQNAGLQNSMAAQNMAIQNAGLQNYMEAQNMAGLQNSMAAQNMASQNAAGLSAPVHCDARDNEPRSSYFHPFEKLFG